MASCNKTLLSDCFSAGAPKQPQSTALATRYVTTMKYLLVSLLLTFPQISIAAPLDTVLVLIDKRTEEELGSFSAERDALAAGLVKLAKLGAKEVLLKFFLDLQKEDKENALLRQAIAKLPVTLQARIDNTESNPNELLSKHVLGSGFRSVKSGAHGNSGWLPIIDFSREAKAVGFIDSISPTFFVEAYGSQTVGTLYFHALESIYGAAFEIRDGELHLAGKRVSLNQKGEFELVWLPYEVHPYVSLIDLLNDDISAEKIRGKYVVFGYDGKDIHQVDTPVGSLNVHLAFYHSLLSTIAAFEKSREGIFTK